MRRVDWKRMLASAAGGVLLTGAFPKVGLDFLAWGAMVPLLAAVSGCRFGEAFRIGLVGGVAHYLSLIYWVATTMQIYGHLPPVVSIPVLFLLCAYLSLYVALFAGFFARLSHRPVLAALSVPLMWVALELLRARAFTGFPWELLGYSQYRRIALIQVADFSGVYGVSFLVAAVNSALFLAGKAVYRTRSQAGKVGIKTAAAALVAAVGLVAAAWTYGQFRCNRLETVLSGARSVRIAVVQGNIPQEIKWDRAFQEGTARKYAALSMASRSANPDLVVWPETATPFYFPYDARLSRIVIEGVRQTGADFLIGSPSFQEGPSGTAYFNSAYLVEADGTVGERYDKVHLVPFGEYVPFKRYLPFLGKMVENVGDFRPGKEGSALSWRKGRLGVLICYELIFPELSRAMVGAGADLLVNLTNDAWYGRSSAPYQHFSMAVFRAVENRRALVRAANTGISGFIDPLGRITAKSDLFKDEVITRQVPIFSENSMYTRFGDVFALLCAILAAGMGAAGIRKP